jgi:DeoR family transcriptional regulator, aga operon transcriptional repressor
MRAAEEMAGPSVLFIGVGTTTEQFSLFLTPAPGLQVITGSLPIASLLGSRPVHVITLGGTVREEELSCVGPVATATIARYRADIAVLGAAGVSARYGITEFDDDVAEVNRAAISHSSRIVVLADASKIGADAHAVVAPPAAISMLVTSAGAPEGELELLRAAGVEIVIARAGRQRHPRRTVQVTSAEWQAERTDDGRRAPGGHRRAAHENGEIGQ